ncbi:MAG: hypothetical protein R3D05_05110 [Dongiaceae bacterium]
MNKSTSQRAEEARRQAQEALIEARERQNALLHERAMIFASETQKVENLRALRLAKMERAKSAGETEVGAQPPRIKRRRLRTAA